MNYNEYIASLLEDAANLLVLDEDGVSYYNDPTPEEFQQQHISRRKRLGDLEHAFKKWEPKTGRDFDSAKKNGDRTGFRVDTTPIRNRAAELEAKHPKLQGLKDSGTKFSPEVIEKMRARLTKQYGEEYANKRIEELLNKAAGIRAQSRTARVDRAIKIKSQLRDQADKEFGLK